MEWLTFIGVLLSGVAATISWASRVNTRLAVMSSQLAELNGKVLKLLAAYEQGIARCVLHEARLEQHAMELSKLAEKLDEVR